MADSLTSLILDIVPADGSTIGNKALLTEIQRRRPRTTESAYLRNHAKLSTLFSARGAMV
ncbi:hypothetical protein [Azospirillum griseum]|uniref:Transposase n=1 Tax=Azospirillum griseum TaxID=2496639 RepID=A0A3S0K0R7_9PROT|nr:hypothetical protein [Azospirillum griseum]RTR11325.1 hypothetical protein EJ903_26125 [Azospirillum griseum]